MMATRKNPSAIMIRAATLDDAPRLAQLSGQLGYPSTSDQVTERLAPILSDPEHIILVAEPDSGGISGWVDVFVMRAIAADPRAEIAGLVVDESSRSQGIGRLLMTGAEEWARAKSCAAVSLRSNVIRERAHEFYERLGYQLIKTQKSYRKML